MASVEKQRNHHRQFKKGDRIKLQDGREATVKFEGSVLFSNGYFVGIALDGATGKHDGRINGRRYFHCRPNHGLFVRPISINHKIKSARNNQWRIKSNDYYNDNYNNHNNHNRYYNNNNYNKNIKPNNNKSVPNKSVSNINDNDNKVLLPSNNCKMNANPMPTMIIPAINHANPLNQMNPMNPRNQMNPLPMNPLHPSALISAFPLTHQNINLYNSIPNHLYNIINSRSTPNSLYSSQLPPYPASTVSCLSYQGGLGGLRSITTKALKILNNKVLSEENVVDDKQDIDDIDDKDKVDKEKLKKHIYRLSNFEDDDDIKDDTDYFTLKLERRRSYPFVERELHLGKLLRIRSRVNDKLRQEKRSLKTKIDEVQNTSTELCIKNEELKKENKENIHKLHCIKKDIADILDTQSNKDLTNVFDNYLKDFDVNHDNALTLNTLNLNDKIKNDRKTGAKLQKRRLRMWNNPSYNIDENSTTNNEDNLSEDNQNLIEQLKGNWISPNQHQQYIIDFIEKFPSNEKCAEYLRGINPNNGHHRFPSYNYYRNNRSTASPSPSTDSSVSAKKLPFGSIPELQDGL